MARDPSVSASSGRPTWHKPLAVAVGTTAVVTLLSYLLPDAHAATGVGMGFLAATYLVALRSSGDESARRHGLSLGGLLDLAPLAPRRLLRDGAAALGWAAALAALVFPAFWIGYVAWWKPAQAFHAAPLESILDDLPGQILVIALPEEAFYRGYLQTAFDEAWPPRRSVLGARFGPGLLAASALFAIGHVATEVHPERLAVFFPALAFGWLRARTGGIGAPIAFHAACNLFASYLGRSYGLGT